MAFEINEGANRTADAEQDPRRRKIFIAVAAVALLLLAGLAYLMTRPRAPYVEPRLEAAIRPGDPAFAEIADKLVLDDKDAFEAKRAAGDTVMTLKGTVRNFTGRTLAGLEVRGTVVDSAGNPVRQRTVIALPSGARAQLETNKTMPVEVFIEGFRQADDRANYQLEITGVRFK